MKKSNIQIRHPKPGDLEEMQRLFVDTVSIVCKNDYTPGQISTWASSVENTPRWADKLRSQYFLIAEIDNTIVGYASLENKDYLDFLYVHKDFQRQGIADKLYAEIEREAIKGNAAFLNSDVSKTAKGFFEKKGFKTLRTQTNTIKGVEITSYKMSKAL